MNQPTIAISDEVRDAVAARRPVLALESTIFTHGLPRPRNEEVALEAERDLRAQGVTPATVGVVAGVPTVGLTTQQITDLSRSDDVVKASVRDLPIAMAKGLSGGTTVAATAYLAHLAGVRVFSTGGLGGVHRGAQHTFDESADLLTLAGLPMVVISAGVKSILDIPLTLERLETLNLTVVGYQTTDYPGFYTTDSGYDIDYRVDTPGEVADMARGRDALGITSTILVANPVAAGQQIDPALIDQMITEALAAADAAGIHGHDVTPYLLDYIQRGTGGRSLDVNVAVYRGNVALGARIAQALAAR